MNRKLVKTSFFLLIGLFLIILSNKTIEAKTSDGTKSLSGFSLLLDEYYKNNPKAKSDGSLSLLSLDIEIPENIAIANVKDYVNIREKPGTSYGVIGYLPVNGYCIVESIENGWAKMKSGDVEGYISTDYLFTGKEGRKKAKEIINLMAICEAGHVNFREEPSTKTNDNILAEVTRGEMLDVIQETVVNKDDEVDLWVKVYVDDMEGYVAKKFVRLSYEWATAVSLFSDEAQNSQSGISALRTALIVEAKSHIGLPYVWGGNSLTSGADCSGFCLAVYKKCGVNKGLPRASYDICASSKGTSVSLSEAKPGDLVFYASSSGHVNHVAMYIGNGQIIHEAGRTRGCMISRVDYRKIHKIKNFLD